MSDAQLALQRFLRRLEIGGALADVERQAILALPTQRVTAPGRRDLVRPGERVDHAILVADGLLARYDMMRDGARQITAFHLPGEMCDLHSVVAPTTGWGITALAASVVLHVPHAELRALVARHPALALAFWRDTTLDGSILAKWVANIGRKSARNRIAHLYCEMGARAEQAGIGTRVCYTLSATQEQIGDATGLTSVHVNRMIQELRADGMLSVEGGTVTIHNWDRLAAQADFAPAYLLQLDTAS